MKISDRLENKLVQARRAVANAAAQKALDGLPFQDELAQLERYDKLIKLLPPSDRRNLGAASIIGGLCVFFAGLAWAWHIPSAHISVTATTRVVNFRLADPLHFSGSWQLDEHTGLSLANLSELTLPPEFTPQALKGGASFEVMQGQVAVSELRLAAGGALTIFREDPTLHILALGAPLQGQVQLFGDISAVAGSMDETATPTAAHFTNVPGVVSFFEDGTKYHLAARIDLKPKNNIVLRNIKVHMLSLALDESGTGEFASGIEAGTVTIGESGDKVDLTYEDQLHIGAFTGAVKEFLIAPDLLRISFEGRAREVSVGSAGFKRNLVPTWLAYFYYQPHPGFFWGAVVFLWSALWSVRELLFK
jgi:hypothetical protein